MKQTEERLKFKETVILLGIVVCALFVRVWDIDWGLPGVYEEARPMNEAWKLWGWETGRLDFNPHTFGWPSFSIYIAFFTQLATYVFGRVIGLFHTLFEFRRFFETSISTMVLVHRCASMLFGLGGIVVVFLLGAKFMSKNVGLLAALFLTFNFIHVSQSQHINPDIIVTFLTLVSCFYIYLVFTRGKTLDYILAGLFIGLSTATKYLPIILIISLGLAHVLRVRGKLFKSKTWTRRVFFGLLCVGIGFFVASPYCLLDFDTFLRDLTYQRTHMTEAAHFGQEEHVAGWLFYVKMFIGSGLGIPLVLLTLSGIAFGLHTKMRESLLLLSFPVLYFFIIGSWKTVFEHYLLPIIPFFLIFSACGLFWIVNHFTSPKIARVCALLLATVAVFPGGVKLFAYHQTWSMPDTRTMAKIWIEREIPDGALLAMEQYTPTLDEDAYHILTIPLDMTDPEHMAPFYDLRWYADFDYIIISSYVYNRYRRVDDKFEYPKRFYRTLESGHPLVKTFDPGKGHGPTIKIYKQILKSDEIVETEMDSLFAVLRSQKIDKLTFGFLNNLTILLEKKELSARAKYIHERCMEMSPQEADGFYNLGVAYTKQNSFDQAVKRFKEAIQIDPNHAKAYFGLGAAFAAQGHIDEAIQAWKEAVRISPRYAEAYFRLGVALKLKGFMAEAEEAWEKAVAYEPHHAEAHYCLGLVYVDQNQIDRAINELRTSVQIDPENVHAYFVLASLYERKEQIQEAMTAYREAIQIDPEGGEAHYLLGSFFQRQRKIDQAMAEWKRAVETESDHELARIDLGWAFFEQGLLDQAITHWKRAIRLNPEGADTHYYLGNAYVNKGLIDSALVEWNKAVALQPNHSSAQNNLIRAYLLRGNYDQAKQQIHIAQEAGCNVNKELLTDVSKVVGD